ncbi:MAG: glycosyltransferase family 2 protein [Pelagibacterales bacterium]|nr:glycosyltransferase family 2 protein [Pelagibacterales bacterium]
MNEEKLQPDISIILPIFNGAKTISNTLNSLINQTYNNYELIICNDGSTDNSEEIINSFKIKNIKVIRNNVNRGLGFTLNKLIKNINSNSKYIAMAEQDDYYYPDRLLLQFEYMERYQSVGLVSGIADHWDGTQITSQFPGLLLKGQQYPSGETFFKFNYREQCKVVNSCMMIRKSIHQKYHLIFTIKYPSISVDWDYILRFSLVAPIAGIHHSLVRLDRSINRNSLTANTQLKNQTAREIIDDFFNEFPLILDKIDYKYALSTQLYLELSNKKYFGRLVNIIKIFFIDPDFSRYKIKFYKNILSPLLKMFL